MKRVIAILINGFVMIALSTANPQGQPLFSFALITDIHYAELPPEGGRFYEKSLNKLRASLSQISEMAPEFIINMGDMAEESMNYSTSVTNLFDEYDIKVYHTPGNHDYYFGRSGVRRIIALTRSDNGYYSFDLNGFRLIFLNGNDMAPYSPFIRERREGARLL